MAPRVVIVGAGFGGVCAAVALLRAGFTELTVLDSARRVGGVWSENAYPGCACDVPASLYSYSFAPNPSWTRRYPPQAEIQAYLEDVVDRFGVREHLRLGVTVTGAAFDPSRGSWTVRTTGGPATDAPATDAPTDGGRIECEVLVCAVGQLSRPALPDLPGLESFAGTAVHSSRWSDDVRVAGRDVAVVGTGASAIQIVPAVAGTARRVTVYQRSAPWTLPKVDRRYGRLHRALGRSAPASARIARLLTWWSTAFMGAAVTGNAAAARALRLVSDLQRRIQVPDPQLRARVTPDHALGCKRILFTSTWFPTLRRPDVELVTERIERIVPEGVRTVDGRTRRADVLVLGTGFCATDLLAPVEIRGRTRLLSQAWADGARAYLGMTVPGFPNLFLLYGPNTNTGNTSVVYFHERQARYLTQAVRLVAAQGGGTVEVRAEVEEAWDREIQGRLDRSVWATCSNWYRNGSGRIVTNWPGQAREYARRTARFEPSDYLVTARRPGSREEL